MEKKRRGRASRLIWKVRVSRASHTMYLYRAVEWKYSATNARQNSIEF